MSDDQTVNNVSAQLAGTMLGEAFDKVVACHKDYMKAKKDGVKAAGTRVRKNMMEVKKLALDIRKEMLEARPE